MRVFYFFIFLFFLESTMTETKNWHYTLSAVHALHSSLTLTDVLIQDTEGADQFFFADYQHSLFSSDS